MQRSPKRIIVKKNKKRKCSRTGSSVASNSSTETHSAASKRLTVSYCDALPIWNVLFILDDLLKHTPCVCRRRCRRCLFAPLRRFCLIWRDSGTLRSLGKPQKSRLFIGRLHYNSSRFLYGKTISAVSSIGVFVISAKLTGRGKHCGHWAVPLERTAAPSNSLPAIGYVCYYARNQSEQAVS